MYNPGGGVGYFSIDANLEQMEGNVPAAVQAEKPARLAISRKLSELGFSPSLAPGALDLLLQDGKQHWSFRRLRVGKFLNSKWFEAFMGFVSISNLVVVAMAADKVAFCLASDGSWQWGSSETCGSDPMLLRMVELSMLFLYTVELIALGYVCQAEFLAAPWNILYFAIVVSNLVGEIAFAAEDVRILRILRALRLLRIFKTLMAARELYLIITGFLSTMRTIFWASLLLMIFLSIISIITVEFVHPIAMAVHAAGGCADVDCSRAFGTVMESNLTFFQIFILGDNWGAYAIPIIDAAPWTGLIFISTAMTIFMGFGNLIMAIIVESAAAAREQDGEYQQILRKKERAHARLKLEQLCKSLDKDNSGTLSRTELFENATGNKRMVACLTAMDVDMSDIECTFECMDMDGSGDITYTEFIDALFKMKDASTSMLLMYLKFQTTKILDSVQKGESKLQAMREDHEKFKDVAFYRSGEPFSTHVAYTGEAFALLRARVLEQLSSITDEVLHDPQLDASQAAYSALLMQRLEETLKELKTHTPPKGGKVNRAAQHMPYQAPPPLGRAADPAAPQKGGVSGAGRFATLWSGHRSSRDSATQGSLDNGSPLLQLPTEPGPAEARP